MFSSVMIHPVDWIKALSSALELSVTGISEHHHRTAIIARNIGVELELTQNQLEILIYASLLHDIGAASNWHEKHFIVHNDDDMMVFNHAEAGYNILKDSPQLGLLAGPIRYHHDRFCGGNPSGFTGTEIPLLSRIIHIADRIEVQIDNSQHILKQRDNIINNLETNGYFDPEIVNAVRNAGKNECFWLDIVNRDGFYDFLKKLGFFGKLTFYMDDIIVIAKIFAKIIDDTSPYTAAHSQNVAKVSERIALYKGFSEVESEKIYLAGLLHDIGKLAVPNEILLKPGKLSVSEFDIVKQHPYYSYYILQQVEGFEDIALWIGSHHETLDGNGYPFGLKAPEINLGSRILATADIYCALLEDRPYREGMTYSQTISIMNDMVKNNKLDAKIVYDLINNIDVSCELVKKHIYK